VIYGAAINIHYFGKGDKKFVGYCNICISCVVLYESTNDHHG
jgi:hypothetical protein